MLISTTLSKIDTPEILSIIDITVTAALGVYVVWVIQSKLTRNRAIKDYYISELIEVKKLYSSFFNKLYKNEYKAKDLKNWFKILSNRIRILEENIGCSFKTDSLQLLEEHSKIQIYITNLEEFNNSWLKKVIFKDQTKNEILNYYTDFNNIIHKSIVKVNMAKSPLKSILK